MTAEHTQERILVVDEDPEDIGFLTHQVLEPLGYEVTTAAEAGRGIEAALRQSPDVIIASLSLPDLNGKDLLVALRAQGIECPVLVAAPEGKENDAIQAFRLGAHDYLVKPFREAEVAAALERALLERRTKQEQHAQPGSSSSQAKQLEKKLHDLTTVYSVSRAISRATSVDQLSELAVDGCRYLAQAEIAWLMLQDDDHVQMILTAQKGLPGEMIGHMHRPWDDGVSKLAVLAQETLSLQQGTPMDFLLRDRVGSALIVPLILDGSCLGTICVARSRKDEFRGGVRNLIEAVAESVFISLNNLARRAVPQSAIPDKQSDSAIEERPNMMVSIQLQQQLDAVYQELGEILPLVEYATGKRIIALRESMDQFRNNLIDQS
jgi:DNA-binding response OmpR family regulator